MKPIEIKSGNLIAKVSYGKFGGYRYKSPRYGYKVAHRYDALIYVWLNGRKLIARKGVKNTSKRWIMSYLADINTWLDAFNNKSQSTNLVELYKAKKELGIL